MLPFLQLEYCWQISLKWLSSCLGRCKQCRYQKIVCFSNQLFRRANRRIDMGQKFATIFDSRLKWFPVKTKGPVTKIKNIKTELTKILRPTHFLVLKDIKTDKFFFGLIPRIFFLIGVVGLNIYIEAFLENKTETLKTDKVT